MKNRILNLSAFSLVIVAVATVVSGCGNSDSTADQPKVAGTVPITNAPAGKIAPGDGPRNNPAGVTPGAGDADGR